MGSEKKKNEQLEVKFWEKFVFAVLFAQNEQFKLKVVKF